MAQVYVTRVERFNAAHKLWVNDWSEDKNFEVFGKCANKNWHGHNYRLEVTVKGTPDPVTGFVMDAKKLGDLIKREVTEKLDHMNLNLDVDFLKDMQPTSENLCISIWGILDKHITECSLYSVKLYETETIFAEYKGE
ncbi:MAG: 6-carboxytetrahydropterin synthase [Bacteroidota bacterium]